jgi:hypothetical protein
MVDEGEVDIKKRSLMTRTVYSVLKEEIKDDECGRSKLHHCTVLRGGLMWVKMKGHLL